MDKEAMKALRRERKTYIDRAKKRIKEGNRIIKSILDRMKSGPKTVPELAKELKMNTDTVLLYVSALKKYGQVAEGQKEGDYFRYGPAKPQ